MKKIRNIIIKRPVKTISILIVMIIVAFIGILSVELNTGNDTLISDETDIYLDNESYQSTFGKDPIIVLVESEDPFDQSSIDLMYEMQNSIKGINGIFSINSPVVLIEEMSKVLYEQTEEGLYNLSINMKDLGLMMSQLSTQLNQGTNQSPIDLEQLQLQLQTLVDGQNQLGTALVNLKELTTLMATSVERMTLEVEALKDEIEDTNPNASELELLNNVLIDLSVLGQQFTQFDQMENLSQVSMQTVQALSALIINLDTLSNILEEQTLAISNLSSQLALISDNLVLTSDKLNMMNGYFDAFNPGFPSDEQTLNMMLYDGESLRSQFDAFKVSDHQIRMVISLTSDITDAEVGLISDKLFEIAELNDLSDHVLISGKPILDQSIKSSMMDSMQVMMITSVVIMIIILMLVYKVRLRLLPLFMIMIVVVATIGVMGWLNIGLTMVSMAVFPVLIGLGIDYFIQFQTRYEEESLGVIYDN
jgi:predicted RND superfamily exporter protein